MTRHWLPLADHIALMYGPSRYSCRSWRRYFALSSEHVVGRALRWSVIHHEDPRRRIGLLRWRGQREWAEEQVKNMLVDL